MAYEGNQMKRRMKIRTMIMRFLKMIAGVPIGNIWPMVDIGYQTLEVNDEY